MARKPPVDWTNVLTALVIAGVSGGVTYLATRDDNLTTLQAQATMMPDRRDRELDQLIARVSALEARCE